MVGGGREDGNGGTFVNLDLCGLKNGCVGGVGGDGTEYCLFLVFTNGFSAGGRGWEGDGHP